MGILKDQFNKVGKKFFGTPGRYNRPTGIGFARARSKDDNLYKAIIPGFIYKPPFGYPRNTDIPELRRLARTPYVEMCVSAIVDEIAAMDWDIVPRDEEDTAPDEAIERARDLFNDPNVNNESFEEQLRKIVRDILVIDSGVWVKVFDRKMDLKELYVRDGGTFLKNPDVFGTMANTDRYIPPIDVEMEEPIRSPEQLDPEIREKYDRAAYYQYGWQTGSQPIPFGRDEVVYIMRNPRTDSVYGLSPVQVLHKTIQMLVYGQDHNLEYYTDNNIPKGVLQMVNAGEDEIKEFREKWMENMRRPDEVGNWRKKWHKMPITNKEGDFVKIQFSNAELELLEQQEWFTKVVWATFGVTPTELGMDSDSPSKAHEIVQSKVFRRRALIPLLNRIEYAINQEIVWKEIDDQIKFEFDRFDIAEAKKKQEFYGQQIDNGLRTINEIRTEEMNLEPLDHPAANEPIPGGMTLDVMRDEAGPETDGNDTFTDQSEDVDDKSAQTKPVGPFDTFEECVASMQDQGHGEDAARRICGSMEQEQKGGGIPLGLMIRKAALSTDSPLAPKEGEEVLDPDDVKEIILQTLREQMDDVKEFIEDRAGEPVLEEIGAGAEDEELKAISPEDVDRAKRMVALSQVEDTVKEMVRDQFMAELGDQIDGEPAEGIVPDMNVLNFLEEHTFDNVRDLEEEVRNDLRAELERGVLNGDSTAQLQDRVEQAMDVNENRAQAIARTEANRAQNAGRATGAQASELDMVKRWNAQLDEKTSEICRRMDGQMQEVGDQFVDPKTGDRFMHPPSHVNCRTRVDFIPVDDLSDDELAKVGEV